MFGSDRIQTRFRERGLETSSLVGVAPGYFSVASATALLLSFTARQLGTFECYRSWTSGPSRSLLACRSQAEAESALWSLPSFAFCSTGAESVMRSLPSLALPRREQRMLDLSEP